MFQSLQLFSAAWESFRTSLSGLWDAALPTCAQLLGVTLAALSHLMEGYKEDRLGLLSEVCSERTTDKGLQAATTQIIIIFEEFFKQEVSQALQQAAQRGCGTSIL